MRIKTATGTVLSVGKGNYLFISVVVLIYLCTLTQPLQITLAVCTGLFGCEKEVATGQDVLSLTQSSQTQPACNTSQQNMQLDVSKCLILSEHVGSSVMGSKYSLTCN